LEAGLWQATMFQHPLFLVSVQELAVERDSLALHVLSGVPEAARNTVVEALRAEPGLWPNYGPWLSGNEPAIWQEISRMAAQQSQDYTFDLGPLTEYLRQGGRLRDMKSFLEAFGAKQTVEVLGVEQTVEAFGPEEFWARLSPELRGALRRLAQQEEPPAP
jgi:hypothetical protein